MLESKGFFFFKFFKSKLVKKKLLIWLQNFQAPPLIRIAHGYKYKREYKRESLQIKGPSQYTKEFFVSFLWEV